MTTLTPMMRQYREIKEKYRDCILFFRLGDFYEMFEEDATRGSKILGITLTGRNGTPMCGIPFHASENYLAKLTAAGEKVAICEQVSDTTLPGIVRREVVRVVTPGTTFSEALLDDKAHRFVLSIHARRDTFGLAAADITTGAFWVTEVRGYDTLATELQRLAPREVLLPRETEDANLRELLGAFENLHVYAYDTPHDATQTLQKHFQVNGIEAFGIEQWPLAVQAAGLLLNYLKDTQKSELEHLKSLKPYTATDHMLLDEATLRNLELLETVRDRHREGSLLNVLDQTQTAMGGRLLKQWVLRPLTNRSRIEARRDAVSELYANESLRRELGEEVERILDLERVVGRLTLDRGTPRDLTALKVSLERIPSIQKKLENTTAPLLATLRTKLHQLTELVALIDRAIVDEPPLNVKEGGFIREGFHADLDELRAVSTSGKSTIQAMQQREIERSGINSLKIKYNRVFGYYIEISNSNLANIPSDYTRKQTLVNAERFITPELKEYEEKVLTADDRSKAIEAELFKEIRAAVMEELRAIQRNAEAVATLDVLKTLADVAHRRRYARPTFNDEGRFDIEDGRHPVVEAMNPAGDFVPNGVSLPNDQHIHLLTGPNMSGKSTFLRQTALIALLAQIGSFVPARRADLSLVDRIFTRVGASDNLVRGQSTFMVEMQEAANILNNATAQSLVILDEIGRGTSTYDGLSIAWAILEHLHDHIRAKSLFATHYHELISVAERLPRARNFSVAVEEDAHRGVVFLHKIVEGGIDKSYGIEVAKLAGLPEGVIQKAQHILSELEEGVLETGIRAELAQTPNDDQIGLFGPSTTPNSNLMARDHGKVTHPMEALRALDELKKNGL